MDRSRDATKTITRPEEDGEAFIEEMNQLYRSFGLNAIEVERAVRTIVPKVWEEIGIHLLMATHFHLVMQITLHK